MKEFDKLIENTFDQKSNKSGFAFEDLISLVESSLDEVYDKVVLSEREMRPSTDAGAISAKKKTAKEFLLSLPKFSPNESWGDPNSVDRQTVDKIFSVIGGGATLGEKLKFIQQIANPSNKITSTRRIISTLIILESLAAVVNNFSSSPAGFVFEGFLAALLKGKQEAERSERGNLPIQDLIGFSEIGGGTPISLKMLRETGQIEGSYSNLIDALDEFGKIVYVVARKMGDEIALEQFVLTRDNFIDAISSKASGKRSIEVDLFKLSGYSSEQSVNYINRLKTWPEKFKALQKTVAYQYGESEPTQLDDYENEKAQKEKDKESQQKSSQQKMVEDHWSYDLWVKASEDIEDVEKTDLDELGLDPTGTDYPSDPDEAARKDAVFWRSTNGGGSARGSSIRKKMREMGASSPQEVKLKRLEKMANYGYLRNLWESRQPNILSESKGPQWKITDVQLPKMKDIEYKLLGTLPYSSDKIEKIAEMHMDKLNSSLLEIFESTKALSDNVNNYFTYEERGKAIESGESAIDDAQKIETSLRKEISEKD